MLFELFEIKNQFRLESARHLPRLSKDHPCARIHGHSFQIVTCLRGPLVSDLEWVRDYHEITTTVESLLKTLDHRLLNEIPGLENPTTENLCRYLFQNLKLKLPQLYQVSIKETSTTECIFPVYA